MSPPNRHQHEPPCQDPACPDAQEGGAVVAGDVIITVTRSAGDDRAVLVFIDTDFEPSGKSPGLRVLINDDEAYVGKAYDLGAHHEAKSVSFGVRLDDIAYTGRELA